MTNPFAARDVIIFYERSAGIHFADQDSKKDFNQALTGRGSLLGTDYQKNLPKTPSKVFELLEDYFCIRFSTGIQN